MADRLTQLQDCLDNLLAQMSGSLQYIQEQHPYGVIPGQPSQAPESAAPSTPAATNASSARANGEAGQRRQSEAAGTPLPETPDRFDAKIREMARNLVLQEQQIEILIHSLPGIGATEAERDRRIQDLEAELKQVEKERAEAEEEREKMVDMLGQVIVGAKRVR